MPTATTRPPMSSPNSLLLSPALACACALSACSWLNPEDEAPADNPNAPKLVGRIASIPPDRRFVLIQSYGKWSVPPGTTLTVHGPDGRNANLTATGESLRHYAAADLKSGTLEIGDGVYAPPEGQKANPQASTEPPTDPKMSAD